MGLLTDPHNHGRLTTLLRDHATKLSVLCYLGGVVWFGMLAWEPCNNKTYFSENALLPGLVQREFDMGNVASQTLETLKEEAARNPGIPYTWLQAQFRQLGLDVYLHNFTLHYPFGSKQSYPGKNVYAILRAPRASGTEAIVLSTPYRDADNMHGTTLPSVALLVSLAKFFKRQIYWAKDVIFLVSDHELVGFQAWLEAYHSSVSSPQVLDSGQLAGRSGAIQAALNLEIPDERLSHVDIKVEGLNGQLPNLDLFNLAVEMCLRESVVATFHSQASPAETRSWEGWLRALRTMLESMGAQGTGAPSGGHGLFHRFAIQALTLQGHSGGFDVPRATLTQLGRVLEGMLRSLNNLLERFHQSFFFYLLPGCRRYVSIGLYVPPFALLASPVLIQALALYLSSEEKKPAGGQSLWSALPHALSTYVPGYVLCTLPSLLPPEWPFKPALYVGSCVVLFSSQLLFLASPLRSAGCARSSRCLALLSLGAFLYTLALVNVSAAAFLAVLYVPVAVTCGVFVGRAGRFLHSLVLSALQPLLLGFLLLLLLSSSSGEPWGPWGHHLLSAHANLLLFTVEDWFLYGSYNYPGVCALLFPVWLQLWTIPSSTH